LDHHHSSCKPLPLFKQQYAQQCHHAAVREYEPAVHPLRCQNAPETAGHSKAMPAWNELHKTAASAAAVLLPPPLLLLLFSAVLKCHHAAVREHTPAVHPPKCPNAPDTAGHSNGMNCARPLHWPLLWPTLIVAAAAAAAVQVPPCGHKREAAHQTHAHTELTMV
jgi:hypothetical protein